MLCMKFLKKIDNPDLCNSSFILWGHLAFLYPRKGVFRGRLAQGKKNIAFELSF